MSWYNPFSWFRSKPQVNSPDLSFAYDPPLQAKDSLERVIEKAQQKYKNVDTPIPYTAAKKPERHPDNKPEGHPESHPMRKPKKKPEKKKEASSDSDYLTPAIAGYMLGSMGATRSEEPSTYARSSGDYSGGGSSVSVDDTPIRSTSYDSGPSYSPSSSSSYSSSDSSSSYSSSDSSSSDSGSSSSSFD